MSERSDAFYKPPPADWIPKEGERVFIRPRTPGGGMVAYVTVRYFVPPNFVRVQFNYGGKKWQRSLTLDDIRPLPVKPCKHEHLNMEGICHACGADCRGIS